MKLELGISDYNLLLELMQRGYGLEGKTALLQLCKSLWMKSQKQEEEFTQHFETAFSQMLQFIAEQKAEDVRADERESEDSEEVEETGTEEEQTEDDTSEEEKPESGSEKPLRNQSKKELYASLEESSATQFQNETVDHSNPYNFVFSDEFLPFTEREVSQIWRSVSRPVPGYAHTKLNIPETVEHIAREGVFIEPVYEQSSTNTVRLLILIDRGRLYDAVSRDG